MTIELKKYAILDLMSEVTEINDGLFEILMAANTPEEYTNFQLRNEAACKRKEEIKKRPLNERISYYVALNKDITRLVQKEKYEDAAKVKKEMEYFRVSYLDKMPKKELRPFCK